MARSSRERSASRSREKRKEKDKEKDRDGDKHRTKDNEHREKNNEKYNSKKRGYNSRSRSREKNREYYNNSNDSLKSKGNENSNTKLDSVLESFKNSDYRTKRYNLNELTSRNEYRQLIASVITNRSIWSKSPSPRVFKELQVENKIGFSKKSEEKKTKSSKETLKKKKKIYSDDNSWSSSSESETEFKHKSKKILAESLPLENILQNSVDPTLLVSTIQPEQNLSHLPNISNSYDFGPTIPADVAVNHLLKGYILLFAVLYLGGAAAYVQAGQRIPRKGEVGLSNEEIEEFEKIGYVMSGSRRKKMNAIRVKTENQIYNAEEKAALAQLNFEEKILKEKKLIADLKKYIDKDQENHLL